MKVEKLRIAIAGRIHTLVAEKLNCGAAPLRRNELVFTISDNCLLGKIAVAEDASQKVASISQFGHLKIQQFIFKLVAIPYGRPFKIIVEQ